MALFLPLILIGAVITLIILHRARDRGLAGYLRAVEADLAAAPGAGHPGAPPPQDPPADLPHHLHAIIHEAYRTGPADPDAIRRARAAVSEYRQFRGWKD
jgi:hypothetical protein